MESQEEKIIKKSILITIVKGIFDVKVLLAVFGFATLTFQYHISQKQDKISLTQDTTAAIQKQDTTKNRISKGRFDSLLIKVDYIYQSRLRQDSLSTHRLRH